MKQGFSYDICARYGLISDICISVIKMKKLVFLATIVIALSACADKKAKRKAILDDIIKVHDRVMAADDQLMNNKNAVEDSLAKKGLTANTGDSVHFYLYKVNLADSLMGEWMHQFDPEQPNKTDDQKLTYFTSEKKKIMSIDSQMSAVIRQSNYYLRKNRTK